MIKRMVELHGREATSWLASLDNDRGSIKALEDWGAREETYRLRIEVEEPTGWELRGSLPPGGPLLAEDRVIPLDVSRVRNNQLRIRLAHSGGVLGFEFFRCRLWSR